MTDRRAQKWQDKEETPDIVRCFYTLNKELRQLKHLFASYQTMIERVLAEKAPPSDPAYANASEGAVEKLSKKARDRFQRLREQLESLMLESIRDYLDETESLKNTVWPPGLLSFSHENQVVLLTRICAPSTST